MQNHGQWGGHAQSECDFIHLEMVKVKRPGSKEYRQTRENVGGVEYWGLTSELIFQVHVHTFFLFMVDSSCDSSGVHSNYLEVMPLFL